MIHEHFTIEFIWQGKEIFGQCIPTRMPEIIGGIGYIVMSDDTGPHFSFEFIENDKREIQLSGIGEYTPNRFENMGQVILEALTAYKNKDARTYAEIEEMANKSINRYLIRTPVEERNLKSNAAEKDLIPKLRSLFQNDIFYDENKSCYTIRLVISDSKPQFYDFYPKADKVLIRAQNRWIRNGAHWLKSTFDEDFKLNRETNSWKSEHHKNRHDWNSK